MPPMFKFDMTGEKLETLARLCGGAALLTLAALFLSSTSIGGRALTAATYYSYPLGAKISITSSPTSLYAGSSALVTWVATSSPGPNTILPGSCSLTASPAIDTSRPGYEIFNTGKNLPGAVTGNQFLVYGGFIYSYGGVGSRAIYKAPVSDPTNWSDTGKLLPGQLGASQVAVAGNSIYLFGGKATSTATSMIYAASTTDPTTWIVSNATLPVATAGATLATSSTNFYLIGGTGTTSILTAPISNPTQWSSTYKANPTGDFVTTPTILNMGGVLWWFGGDLGATGFVTANTHIYTSSTYDPTNWTDTGWTSSAGYHGARGIVLGNDIYFYGYNFSISSLTNDDVIHGTTDDPLHTMGHTPMPLPVSLASSTFFSPNGTDIYLVGAGGSAIYSNTVNNPALWSVYNLTLQSKSTVIPANRMFAQTTVINGDIYVFGGDDGTTGPGGGAKNTIYKTNSSSFFTNTINPISWPSFGFGTLPANIEQSQLVTVGKNIYLLGGEDSSGTFTNIYAASTSNATSTWMDTGKVLPGKLSRSQAAVVGDNIFLFGGEGSSAVTNVIYAASTSNPSVWVNTGKTLVSSLESSQLAIIGPNIYLFGGKLSASVTAKIYAASTTNPTKWIDTGKSLPAARYNATLAVLGGNIYMYGGQAVTTGTPPGTNTIFTASSTNPEKWVQLGTTLPYNLSGAQVVQYGNAAYIFGMGDGANGAGAADNMIWVAAATNTTAFYSYGMPSWKTDWSANVAQTWPTVDQTEDYIYSCKDRSGASGSADQVISAAPKPVITLTQQMVFGTSSISWNAQNVTSCTIEGTFVPLQSTTTSGTVQVRVGTGYSNSNTATSTVICTTLLGTTITKSVTAKNGWYYAAMGLPAYGNSYAASAYTDSSNRANDGWPAPLVCSYPPVDGNTQTCAEHAYGTVFGVFSAYQNSKFSNGSIAYFTAMNSQFRNNVSGWDNNWTTTLIKSGGDTLQVPVNTPVTLEWACQEQQRDYFEQNCGVFGTSMCTATYYGWSDNSNSLQLFNVSSTTNFATTSTRGYTTVISPAVAGNSTTYYFQCKRTANNTLGPIMKKTVKSVAAGTASPPTATIDADAATVANNYVVNVGDTVTITANFAADPADVGGLVGTSIYGNDQVTTVPCAGVTPTPQNGTCDLPDATKTYTFIPSTGGVYNFYAAERTGTYNTNSPMDTYASVQVTVLSNTPTLTITNVSNNISEPSTDGSFRFTIDAAQASDVVINYTVSGSASATTSADYAALSGTATITAGNTFVTVPITVTGYNDSVYEGTETVVINAASSASYNGTPTATINIADDDFTALPPGSFNSCASYSGPNCTLSVNPARLRTGTPTTVAWYVQGVVTGANGNAGDSCTVTSSPVGLVNANIGLTYPLNGSNNWLGTTTVTITKPTIFTLTCTAPDLSTKKTVSKSVTLIPTYQEI